MAAVVGAGRVVNALAEVVRSLLSRPLVTWASLAFAALAYLLYVQLIGLPAGISAKAKDALSVGAIATLFVSSAFFVVLSATRIATSLRKPLHSVAYRLSLLRRIRHLPPDSIAVLYALALKNRSSAWFRFDLAGVGELRRANLLRLTETYGQALHYEVELEAHVWLQQNLVIVEAWTVTVEQMNRIAASETEANRLLSTRWMSA